MLEGEGLSEAMERFERNIEKEVTKLKYYLEPADELLEVNDYVEMEIAVKQGTQIIDRITDLISQLEEMKLDSGVSPRDVRQWKKDKKHEFSALVQEKIKLSEALTAKQKQKEDEIERANWEARREREERVTREKQEQEKRHWEEKFRAELRAAEKKLEMETAAKATHAKLPKLKITPFKGTPTDWVRFENMFVTQVHDKPITPEEKFGYLLEMVSPKVRESIANLQPGGLGYKVAWERLKSEYGQTKLVINAHIDEIINLPVIKGTNYVKIKEFYEKVSKNHDALLTLGETDMLRGFVMTTLNKLPHVKPDLVRTDDNWEDWSMEAFIDGLKKWLKRHKTEEQPGDSQKVPADPSKWRRDPPKPPGGRHRNEEHGYAAEGEEKQPSDTTKSTPVCLYCKKGHWGDRCETYKTLESRRKFLADNRLCYNCGRGGHIGHHCRSRGCFNCKGRHHTSICDRKENPVLTVYTPSAEETLPAIIPVKINGTTLWAYLDTGSGRNFISAEAIKRLKLNPVRHETRHIVTLSGTQKQSMPIFDLTMDSVDEQARERIEVTGAKLADFTTIRRPDLSTLKWKYEHTKDKRFYKNTGDDYTIHVILGDSTYCRIKTEEVFKGKPGEPIVEGTTFGWIIHGGDDHVTDQCMFAAEVNDYERLYSLDVLGVEDRGENDQLDVLKEFKDDVTRQEDGRYQVGVPWIPGSTLTSTNEQASRKRLQNVNRKLTQNPRLKEEYEKIVEGQLRDGIIERVPVEPSGERTFYMPHKPVVRDNATTTKVRMVFDASAKPHHLANSVNDCMHTGPPLQPLLWDILVRARMSPYLLLGDIEKAFLQISVKEEDRDAFRFLFNINDKEEHFRFTRVPFGAEASPFMLAATLQHHYDCQSEEFGETVKMLRENTYVDNLMKTGHEVEDLNKFKEEATQILGSAKFPVHKWESNVTCLESENMPNPGKILGHVWDKIEDTLIIQVPKPQEEVPLTKRTMLSQLGKVYDPLGIVSPTMVEGKRMYRDACDETKSWNSDLSPTLAKDWNKWMKQLQDVKIPRSLTRGNTAIEAVDIHQFADASSLACSTAAVAVINQGTMNVKGLLASKSRISKRNTTIARLELISGHMAANLAKNLCQALKEWPIRSVTIWMDSMVALYWISNPGKSWKIFVANRVRKIAQISGEVGIQWKYCPSEMNLADLGSRGASLSKMECGEWYTGPQWLLEQEKWPEQPKLTSSTRTQEEEHPCKEIMLCTAVKKPDEWDDLLDRKPFWSTLRITAWALRFAHNSSARLRKEKRKQGPLSTEEIINARDHWVRREQKQIPKDLEKPGWKLVKDEETNILKCIGRIENYRPTYLEKGLFVQKLIRHTHERTMHLGTASTMAAIKEQWWIPKLRSLVKRTIRDCNICKVFAAKPFKGGTTAPLPRFRTEVSRPFEHTGVDFAGPLVYRKDKNEEGKAYILIFTCAVLRAVHLEVTKSQTAEEFQRKLNAFITRKTRPRRIVSDNAAVFKTTADWIRKIRRSEQLLDFLAAQEIRWQFNLAKSPWWGGFYERLLKDVKETLYKTLGKTHLTFEQLEVVVMEIERNMNNRPLTYVESDGGEDQVLTPNLVMWGQDAYALEDVEVEDEELTRFHRRLRSAKPNAWSRWQKEYLQSLMESHRVNRLDSQPPEIGEIVLILGEEKNRGKWKKGKVIRHVRGRDGVVRGVILLHKGHQLERPLSLVCSLEIKGSVATEEAPSQLAPNSQQDERPRSRRQAAERANEKIRLIAADEQDD